MGIQEAKNIYCLGIGGIGVSGLARLLKAQGKNVWGSDLKKTQITEGLESAGIKVLIGHTKENLNPKPDLVIYSLDVSPDSPGFVEMAEIRKLGIEKLTQAQAVGELMRGKYGIGVTGTNGKSTTTALLGLVLEKANLDPTVLIGSLLAPKNESDKFKANARFGHSQYFVAESDEYHKKMLENQPKMIILTNVAEDHLDYYKDLNDIKNAFLEYIQSLPNDGILIYNADDRNAVEVGRQARCHKYTFGIHHYADLQAINVDSKPGKQTFDLHLNDQLIDRISINVPGLFNVSNALAATLAAIKLGVRMDDIKTSLNDYLGIWRRFEKVGEIQGKPVISDYAHHPAGISGTILAAKEFFPGKKILFIFQPHHRNRTKNLLGEFVESLLGADDVIISEIFDVAGREHGEEISSKKIVDVLNEKGARAIYCADLSQTEDVIKKNINAFDALVFMGAGDIDLLARKIST